MPDPAGRIYERMYAHTWGNLKIRVWAQRHTNKEHIEQCIKETCLRCGACRINEDGYMETTIEQCDTIAEIIANEYPSINAVEVLMPDGDGSLAYNDWP